MIEVELQTALSELSQIMLRTAYAQPILALIGQSEVDNAKGRIEHTKRDPSSESWAPWMPSTEAARIKKGNAGRGLLWDEGDLLDSIRFETGEMHVDIGSDLHYAGYLQDGTEKMDARAYLGWSDHSTPFYEAIWLRYIETGVV